MALLNWLWNSFAKPLSRQISQEHCLSHLCILMNLILRLYWGETIAIVFVVLLLLWPMFLAINII